MCSVICRVGFEFISLGIQLEHISSKPKTSSARLCKVKLPNFLAARGRVWERLRRGGAGQNGMGTGWNWDGMGTGHSSSRPQAALPVFVASTAFFVSRLYCPHLPEVYVAWEGADFPRAVIWSGFVCKVGNWTGSL